MGLLRIMPTKNLKFIILLSIGLALAACAHQDPLQLPPPLIVDSDDSGWQNY